MEQTTPTSETQKRALRIVDANMNRASEGLRTIEDYARLVKHDAVAARWLKSFRHQLANTLETTSRPARLATRSAETDAGTEITSNSETVRPDLVDIVSAAAERTTQAMRCLEEYCKIVSPAASREFKELRYQAYDLLAKVELRLGVGDRDRSEQLYLLVDCREQIDEFTAYVRSLADAGVDLFQLRDKRADGAKLLQYARAAVSILEDSTAGLIVNDRVDIALASGAAGVHLGQDDMPLADARRLTGSALRIGISTHTIEQAIEAEQSGADYIGCGPTFESSTKSFSEFAGPAFLKQASQEISIPIFAIGGIDRSNVHQVIQAGCRRIAVSCTVHTADDPVLVATELSNLLTN